MNDASLRRLTGAILILTPVAFNVPRSIGDRVPRADLASGTATPTESLAGSDQ
jgi:hypothetical protein